MKPKNSWQKSCENTFAKYVDPSTGEIFDSEFNEHVEYLRTNVDNLDDMLHDYIDFYTSYLDAFMATFGFGDNTKAFVREFIINDRVDYSLVKSGFVIINATDTKNLAEGAQTEPMYDIDLTNTEHFGFDHIEGRHLSIVIPSTATTTDIRDFITENKKYIDERLNEMRRGRAIRRAPKYNNKRNSRIKELANAGRSVKEIASIISDEFATPLSPADIYTAKHRLGLTRKSDTKS